MKPIKRSAPLVNLSREHHQALLLCWKIKTGIAKGVPLDRMYTYAQWFYQNHLLPHFSIEEKYVFSVLPLDHPLVVQAMSEHQMLSNLFLNIAPTEETMMQIQQVLEKHIRFEERILFNEIQQIANAEQFRTIEEMHKEQPFADNRNDVFWE